MAATTHTKKGIKASSMMLLLLGISNKQQIFRKPESPIEPVLTTTTISLLCLRSRIINTIIPLKKVCNQTQVAILKLLHATPTKSS